MSDDKEARFADLIGEFVDQLAEAMQASYIRQIENAVRIRALIELPLEEYARQQVSDQDLADELQQRRVGKTEREQLRLDIAARQRSFVQGLIKEGVPRCIIDTASLSLKFRFSLDGEKAVAPHPPGSVVPQPPSTPAPEPAPRATAPVKEPANMPPPSATISSTRLDRLDHAVIKRVLAAGISPAPKGPAIKVQAIDIKNASSEGALAGECAIELRFRILYD